MFSNIVLSGGGLAAISYFGCLKYIYENKELKKNIVNILGVSSGSIFALFLLLDISIVECEKWLHDMKTMNINNISFKSIIKLKTSFGLDDSTCVIDIVKKILDIKNIHHSITFKELSKLTGKNFIVCAANISKHELFYFNIDSTPDVAILDAIKASTSIPVIFTPHVHNDEYLVDAFIYDNFPLHYFNDSIEHSFGINLNVPDNNNKDVITFITSLLNSIINYNSIKRHHNECIINTSGNGFDIKKMRFILDESSIQEQTDIGYNTLKDFIEKKIKNFQQNLQFDQ